PMRVESFLGDSARRAPDKEALILGPRRVSYAELDDMAGRLANVLRQSGIGRGDRGVIVADSSDLAVAGVFATLRAGAVFSPINPSTKEDKLAYVLNNCRAKAVITPAGLLPVVAEAARRAPSVVGVLVNDWHAEAAGRDGISLRQAMAAAPA